MIFIQRELYSCCCILIPFLLTLFAFYAYRTNAKRTSDDPKKKVFHPLSPWLAPATPFIWLGRLIFLAPWSILFGIFLITFPFILIVFRPVPPNSPVSRFILKFGNGVLKINTWLLHMLGLQSPQPIRSLSFE